MKNLLIALVVLISAGAYAQTTYTLSANPQTVTITDTNTNFISLPGRWIDVWVRFPSTNVGTVQINTKGSVMTNATVMNATTHPQGILIKARDGFYIKMQNANDKVDIIVYE